MRHSNLFHGCPLLDPRLSVTISYHSHETWTTKAIFSI